MGFASYWEDIRDRQDQAMAGVNAFLRQVEEGPRSTAVRSASPICAHETILAQIRAFHVTWRKTKYDIEEILDLATDPVVDMAANYKELQKRSTNQQKLIFKLQKDIQERSRRILLLEDHTNGARRERDEWKRKANTLQAELARRGQVKSAAVRQ